MTRLPAIRFSGFTLDVEAGALVGPGGPVALRPKAQALLALLARNAGRALGKDEIFAALWAGVTVSDETITQTIHEIRQALGDEAQAVIRTLPRRGYLFAAEPAGPPAALPEGLAVAILPFANLSSDPEQDFFADGLTEDLTSALALIRELYIVPRALSAAQGNRDGAPVDLARSLGAACLLTGSVRMAGDRLRVTTQLVDGATGRQLWWRRFDGAAADIFAFQDQITHEVCMALAVEFTLGDMSLLARGQTADLRAWERMVAAREPFQRFTEADNRRARALLNEALDFDPEYVGAKVLLAMTHWIDARFYATEDRETVLGRIEALAREVLEAQPESGYGWNLLGGVAHLRDRHDEALAFCRKACALAPQDGWIHGFCGSMSNFAGDTAAALAEFAVARRLSAQPFAWIAYNEALALMWEGDFARARQLATGYLAEMPGDPYAYTNLGCIEALAGAPAEARRLVGQLRRRFPEFGLANLRRSQHYRDPARLRRVLSALAAAGLPEG